MTLKECKEIMLEMWWWLYENPDKHKIDFIRDVRPDLYNQMVANCPCCEYVWHLRIDCRSCPADWGKNIVCDYSRADLISDDRDTCIQDLSEKVGMFAKWESCSTRLRSRSRKFYAKEIYKIALRIKVDK